MLLLLCGPMVPNDEAAPEVHGRLLFIASKQMTVQQRSAYAKYAHSVGIDVGEDYARGNERHAVVKRFGGARA